MKTTSPWPICFKTVAGFTFVLLVLSLMGCQTTKPTTVVKIVERKIEVPRSLLTCSDEPVAGTVWVTQREVARFINKLAEAGDDCRIKLAAVKKLVDVQCDFPPDPSNKLTDRKGVEAYVKEVSDANRACQIKMESVKKMVTSK